MTTELAVTPGQLNINDLDIEKARDFGKKLGEFYKSVMQEGTDYGKIEGSQKPSLWKPGAELLTVGLKMKEKSVVDKEIVNYDPNPYFEYRVHCELYTLDGGYLGDGWGSANSKEPGVAFRWLYENQLSDDWKEAKAELPKRVLKSGTVQYRIDTPINDLYMQQNALLKKAKKRAFIDAVLTVTGASRIFTQDIEDYEESDTLKPATGTQKAVPSVGTGAGPNVGIGAGPETATTLEQLQYDFRDLTSLVSKVEETSDGFKLIPKAGLSKAEITAISDIVGTYNGSKKVLEGTNLVWIVPK